MGAQNSLGHFPFGFPEEDESKFDFIPDRKPEPKKKKEDSTEAIIKEIPKPENVSEKGKSAPVSHTFRLGSEKSPQKNTKPKSKANPKPKPKALKGKKVASYYLDKSLIYRLKNAADKNDESYSGYVDKAIRSQLAKENNA